MKDKQESDFLLFYLLLWQHASLTDSLFSQVSFSTNQKLLLINQVRVDNYYGEGILAAGSLLRALAERHCLAAIQKKTILRYTLSLGQTMYSRAEKRKEK